MENRTFYNEILTDHTLHPLHKEKLPDANLVLEGVNPSCGDDIILQLKVEDGQVVDGAFEGSGCAISQASADIMLDLIIGKSEEEARHLADLFLRRIKGEAGEMWYSGTANYSTRLFTDGSGDLAVRTYKTVAWGGELISSTVTAGSLIGVAEVYDGAAQLYPQSAADVADFKVDASTPVITEVDPASLTWGAEETVTKNVAVTVVNLGSNALTVDNDAIAPFTAVVNGTTVTVTPPAPNTTSDDIVRTMTVSVAGGNSREVTLTQFAAGSGGDTKGIYTSMSQFIPASTSTTDRYYPSNSTIDGQPATGFKLGTSSLAGVFTSEALGASLTGDKKLSFYAVAWTGKAATVYIRVNNGGAVSGDGSHAITASAGATGSGNDFTFTDVTDSDYYTFQLTGLTAASTVTISTSPDFTAASDRNTGRAIVLGVQVY